MLVPLFFFSLCSAADSLRCRTGEALFMALVRLLTSQFQDAFGDQRKTLLVQLIVGVVAVFLTVDDPRVPQKPQVLGYSWGGNPQQGCKSTDAVCPLGQQGNDPAAAGLAQDLHSLDIRKAAPPLLWF